MVDVVHIVNVKRKIKILISVVLPKDQSSKTWKLVNESKKEIIAYLTWISFF